MNNKDQVERISSYEKLMRESIEVLERFQEALQEYAAVQEPIKRLEAYYGSAEWWEDFRASEEGQLPEGLLCGVLSEDGLSNLLDDNDELLTTLGELAAGTFIPPLPEDSASPQM